MNVVWESTEGEGWSDGAGVTRRMFRTDEEDVYGYMRGRWAEIKTDGREGVAQAGTSRGRDDRICRVYDTVEEIRADRDVYRAVRAVIRAAHQEDGMTVEQIIRETEAQKKDGRIRYIVVAEAPERIGGYDEKGGGMDEGRLRAGAGRRQQDGRTRKEAVRGGGRREVHHGLGGGAGRKTMDRTCLQGDEDERMRRMREAAAAAGLRLGDRLRRIQGEHIFDKWRWGRVPIEGGGWLVTFRHDPMAGWEVEDGMDRDGEGVGLTGTGREVRHAVVRSQFGWGVYAVCDYGTGERLGWYDGECITAEQWAKLGKYEGHEHTIRTSWARDKIGGARSYMNGIDGVAGMQYINTAYGREEREKQTGRPEYGEKVRFKYNGGRVVVAVKEGQSIRAGEELRVAYSWTQDTWRRIEAGAGEEQGTGMARRGWVEGDERDEIYRGRLGRAYQVEVEEGGREDTVDGAVQLSVADLWRETRIGEPREGIVCGAETEAGWREVYGRDGVWRVHREEWRGGRRIRPSGVGRGTGGAREGAGTGAVRGVTARGGDGEEEGARVEPHWLGGGWIVPQTAEGANELWETLGIEGWERGQEPPGWGPDGERLGQELEASEGVRTEERAQGRRGGGGNVGRKRSRGVRQQRGGDEEGIARQAADSARAGEGDEVRVDEMEEDGNSELGERMEGTVGEGERAARARRGPAEDAAAEAAAGEEDRHLGNRGSKRRRTRAGAAAATSSAAAGEARARDEMQAMAPQAQEVAGRAQGRKRRGRQEDATEDGGWRPCAVGEYRAGSVRVVAGARVVRLAEVVAGRRRTEKAQKRNIPKV